MYKKIVPFVRSAAAVSVSSVAAADDRMTAMKWHKRKGQQIRWLSLTDSESERVGQVNVVLSFVGYKKNRGIPNEDTVFVAQLMGQLFGIIINLFFVSLVICLRGPLIFKFNFVFDFFSLIFFSLFGCLKASVLVRLGPLLLVLLQ